MERSVNPGSEFETSSPDSDPSGLHAGYSAACCRMSVIETWYLYKKILKAENEPDKTFSVAGLCPHFTYLDMQTSKAYSLI
jgi:hypothetical protein